jgi:hypothetical protein
MPFVLLLCVFVIGCAHSGGQRAPKSAATSSATRAVDVDDPAVVLQRIYGSDGLEILRNARNLELIQLAKYSFDVATQPATRASETLADRAIVARKRIRDGRLISAVGSLLTSETSYAFEEWGSPDTDSFGTLAMRFSDAMGRSVVVLYFQEMDALQRFPAPEKPDPLRGAPPLVDRRPELVKLLKEAWPESRLVQAIPERTTQIRQAFPPGAIQLLESSKSVEALQIEHRHTWKMRLRLISRAGYYVRMAVRQLLRIEQDPGEPPQDLAIEPRDTIAGYVVCSRQTLSDSKLIGETVELLLNDRIRDRGRGPIMCFSPGIAFRFGDAKHSATALICFHCEKVYWELDGFNKGGKPSEGLYQQLSRYGFRELAKIAKRAFPNDAAIQAVE